MTLTENFSNENEMVFDFVTRITRLEVYDTFRVCALTSSPFYLNIFNIVQKRLQLY